MVKYFQNPLFLFLRSTTNFILLRCFIIYYRQPFYSISSIMGGLRKITVIFWLTVITETKILKDWLTINRYKSTIDLDRGLTINRYKQQSILTDWPLFDIISVITELSKRNLNFVFRMKDWKIQNSFLQNEIR